MWLAVFNQDTFIHLLEGGEITPRIKMVKRSPVACTLFCLTYQGSIQDMDRSKATSRVEITHVDVPANGSP